MEISPFSYLDIVDFDLCMREDSSSRVMFLFFLSFLIFLPISSFIKVIIVSSLHDIMDNYIMGLSVIPYYGQDSTFTYDILHLLPFVVHKINYR